MKKDFMDKFNIKKKDLIGKYVALYTKDLGRISAIKISGFDDFSADTDNEFYEIHGKVVTGPRKGKQTIILTLSMYAHELKCYDDPNLALLNYDEDYGIEE